MNYEDRLYEVNEKNGEIQEAILKINLEEQQELFERVKQNIENSTKMGGYNTVTPDMERAVIRTDADGKLYFKNKAGKTTIEFTMAEPDLAEQAFKEIGLTEGGRSSAGSSTSSNTTSQRQSSRSTSTSPPQGGNTDYIRYEPEFTKGQVNYVGHEEGPNPHLNCEDCVHYVSDQKSNATGRDSGMCKMVQGEVDDRGHCEDLYADVSFYGRIKSGEFEVSLAGWGDKFFDRIGGVNIEKVGDSIKSAIRRKM